MEKGALSKALQYVKLLKDGSFAGTFFRVRPSKKIPITFREMTFMDKILLHSCCAPCSVYCVDTLRGEGIEPVSLWFNPNIHPWTEYDQRRSTPVSYTHLDVYKRQTTTLTSAIRLRMRPLRAPRSANNASTAARTRSMISALSMLFTYLSSETFF